MSAPTGVALLVIDVQNDILDLYGRTPWMGHVIGNIADAAGGRNVDGTGRRVHGSRSAQPRLRLGD